MKLFPILGVSLFLLFAANITAASDNNAVPVNPATTFLWIAILLVAAKISSLIERLGQPSVLGEMLIGVILGNLSLLGINFFESIKTDAIISFFAELGVVILLFQIGLESNVQKLCKVGWRAFAIAAVGIISTFVLVTYFAGPSFLPGLPFNSYMFLGVTLAATSVGISARIFRDLGKLQTPEAQMVLGAAVIDDVLGLIVLAVATAVITVGIVDANMIGIIVLKAVLFLAGAVVLGQISAPIFGKWFSKINATNGMKFTLAISFGLFLASLAPMISLAPLIGAFAAGLVLDPIHFRYFNNPKIVDDIKSAIERADSKTKKNIEASIIEPYTNHHVEEIIEPLGYFLVPIFFVMIGMHVKLDILLDPTVILISLAFTAIAFMGKLAAGVAAGGTVNRSIVGWGMVPRGEVVLISATIGKTAGVITDQVYSVVIIVVMLSTMITPFILTYLLKPKKAAEPGHILKLKHRQA